MRNDHIRMSLHKSSQNSMATPWVAKEYEENSMTSCGKTGLLSSLKLTLSCDLTAMSTGIVEGLGLDLYDPILSDPSL